jgi:hypothetical protein
MGYTDQTVEEATELQVHSKIFNTDTGFNLSQSWNPAINILQQRKAIKEQLKDGSTACIPNIQVKQH